MAEKDTVELGKASPAVGRAYKGGEAKGQKGFAASGYKYSTPGQQATTGRAYKGGQGAGVKGFAVDPNATKF